MTGATLRDIVFLFSDIEGSTKLWEKHPEEVPQYLRTALEVAVIFDALLPQLRILTRLAPLRGEAWLGQLGDVYEKFTEGFDLPDMVAARTALGLEK